MNNDNEFYEAVREWCDYYRENGRDVIRFGDGYYGRTHLVEAIEDIMKRLPIVAVGLDKISPAEVIFLHQVKRLVGLE